MVATVGEPAGDVGSGDGGEGGPGGRTKGLGGAGFGTTAGLLDLGERFLDGIEVRRVGREVPEPSPTGFDGGPRSLTVVGFELVGDDDLARSEGRSEDVPDLPLEARGGHRPVEPQQRAEAAERQRREHGLVLPAVAGGRSVRPFPTRSPGMRRRVPQVAARLIQEDQVLGGDRYRRLAPGGALGLVALARRQRLFFRVQSSRVSARLIVDGLTSSPDTAYHQVHCSASVASACVARRAGNAAANPRVLTAGRPGTGFIDRSPCARHCFNHRFSVASETINCSVTSARGTPRLTAATTRSRRSSEYPRMLQA